jgi:uroporphyrinogen III methyltransferase/synthase
MGVTALPKVVENLLEAGMPADTPAAMVEQGTTSAQRQVISTLAELPGAIVEAGLQPPALFAIGPTIGHAEHLDWRSDLQLAGQRLLVASSQEKLAEVLERGGADVVLLPLPATPAARVVMGALPLTGCLVASAAEVDWLDEERGNPGWGTDVISWCIGGEAAERARDRGWRHVVEFGEGLDCGELVARIATTHAE